MAVVAAAPRQTLAHRGSRAHFPVLRQLGRHPGVVAGGLLLVAMVICALFAPALAPYDPTEPVARPLLPPGAPNLMGSDNLGRDVFSRVLYGAQLSLSLGVVAVIVGATAGTTIGVVAGVFGKWIDLALMRFIDALMTFPGLLLALAIAAALGPDLRNAMIAVGVAWTPSFARMVRASVLQVRETAYVEAARAIGCGQARLILRHILPNSLTPIIVLSILGLAGAILAGSALSFLGLGPQPPTPEWGAMLSQSRQFMRLGWWTMAFPGLAITITILAANLLGNGLRDVLDPRLRVR
jgi:peptide/nickel transport system permease protein